MTLFIRGTAVIASILMTAGVACGDKYQNATANPKVSFSKVTVPKDTSKPISVRFDLSAQGKRGRFAIARDQFSLQIIQSGFTSDLEFSPNSPAIFIVEAGSPITIEATSSNNRFDDHKNWGAIKPGKYELRIDINSGKNQEFDYQWLGSTHTEAHELQIK